MILGPDHDAHHTKTHRKPPLDATEFGRSPHSSIVSCWRARPRRGWAIFPLVWTKFESLERKPVVDSAKEWRWCAACIKVGQQETEKSNTTEQARGKGAAALARQRWITWPASCFTENSLDGLGHIPVAVEMVELKIRRDCQDLAKTILHKAQPGRLRTAAIFSSQTQILHLPASSIRETLVEV